MSSSLDKLRALTSRLEEKLEEKDRTSDKTEKAVSKSQPEPVEKPLKAKDIVQSAKVGKDFESVRADNIIRVKNLYEKLKIFEKSPDGSETRVNPFSAFWFSWAAAHPDTEVYK